MIKHTMAVLCCMALVTGIFAQDDAASYPVGKVDPSTLFNSKHKETFYPTYTAYEPDAATLKAIKPFLSKLKIKIVMGFWCDDSKEHVPRFLKILDELKFENFKIFGVDENKKAGFEGFNALKIEFVPTFIVYWDDMEIGRIVEKPEASLEKDLLFILQKNKGK